MLERIYLFLDQLGEVGVLTADFFRYLVRRPFEGRLLLDQLDAVGVKSVNVVNLTAIFSGMVLALQMGQFLAKFGAKIYVSRIMGLSLLREMGPVLISLSRTESVPHRPDGNPGLDSNHRTRMSRLTSWSNQDPN